MSQQREDDDCGHDCPEILTLLKLKMYAAQAVYLNLRFSIAVLNDEGSFFVDVKSVYRGQTMYLDQNLHAR